MKKEKIEFTLEEIEETKQLLGQLKSTIGETLNANDEAQLREQLTQAIADGKIQRDVFGLNPVLQSLRTAQIAVDEIGLKRDGVLATILFTLVIDGHLPLEDIRQKYGDGVAHIIHGLVKIHELYKRIPSSRARTSETCSSRSLKTCASSSS